MKIQNVTLVVSFIGWVCLTIYMMAKCRSYRHMENSMEKRLLRELIIIQGWQILILLLIAAEKVNFIIARY